MSTRAIVVGVGEMGRVCVRQLVERGVEVVGAFGNRRNIGCDLGEVCGLGRELGVPVRNDLEDALAEGLGADVAFVTVGSELGPMMGIFSTLLSHGIDVITAAEEPFYPWESSPELSAQIDGLAKEHGATLFAGGIQDVYWLGELLVMTGASHRIERIVGFGGCDVDNYGPGTADVIRVGKTREEYEASLEDRPLERDYFGLALSCIAKALGDEIASIESENIPVFATEPTPSRSLGRVVEPGQVIGQHQITRAATTSGIELETTFATCVGQQECTRWHVLGTPELVLENPVLPGPDATCAALVNRIPDVLAAPAGLVTADQMPAPRYQSHI